MAEEFQGEVCGESWWNNSTKSIFGLSSPLNIYDSIGEFAWPNISDLLDVKSSSRSSNTADDSCNSDDSQVLQELPKHHHNSNLSMDSTLQVLGIGLSTSSYSATPDWHQSCHDKLENINYASILEEDLNYRQEKRVELKRSFSSITQDSSMNNQDFTLPINPITSESTMIYSSDMLQTLFDDNYPNNYALSPTNYSHNLNDFTPNSLPKLKTCLAKQTPPNHLPPSNATSLWNTSTTANIENKSNEPTYKRARIETPSPLPTFKVRKEKMGDRITALQQLVSPFGKTDTASVLQEAIEYIKFLHDQVNVLSTPYVKNGSPTPRQQVKEQEGLKQDLMRRGLCLVPISSTFPAAAESTMDFWSPTFK